MIKYAHTTDYVSTDYDTREDDRMIPESLVMVDVRPDDAEWCPECQSGLVESTGSIYPFATRYVCTDRCGWEA